MADKEDQECQQAFDSYEAGDFETAFAIWHGLALGGDAYAQNNLSAMYDAGEGVEQDRHLAYEWALKAAKSGHPAAMGTVGSKLLSGSGVAQDVEKGLEVLLAAASEGDAGAMRVLGAGYCQGSVLPKDVAAALHWLTKAADLGEPQAQFILASIYDLGMDVPRDRDLSTKWYLLAAESGNVLSMFPAGARLVDGDLTPQDVSKGINFLKLAAEGGVAHAMRKLGDIYLDGKVVPGDTVEALHWYEQGAHLGNVDSQFKLGLLYTQDYRENLIARNPERGVHWLEKAVLQGDTDAISLLAKLLFNGEGVPSDKARAFDLLKRGVEAGDPLCQYFLGRSHLTGNCIELDRTKGVELLTKASDQGMHLAKSCICGLRIRGLDGLIAPEPEAAINEMKQYLDELDRDAAFAAGMHFYPADETREDAIFWLNLAATSGLEEAYFYLGVLLIKSELSEEVHSGISWLIKACPSEGGRAEYNLAEIYKRGEKVAQDIAQAWSWANRSSQLGCEFGKLILVQLQIETDGPYFNPVEAVKLAIELANGGLHNAMTLLGYAYERGLGVAADMKESVAWYARAAQAGSSESGRILGIKYFNGEGVPASRAEAVRWFTPAANGGDLQSMLYLMFAHAEGKEIAEDMVLAYTYLALALPYASGKELELIEMLEPDFRNQISESDRQTAVERADEIRSDKEFALG